MNQYIKVEDKAASRWLIIWVSEFSDHYIVATTKHKYDAQDIVLAMNNWQRVKTEGEE